MMKESARPIYTVGCGPSAHALGRRYQADARRFLKPSRAGVSGPQDGSETGSFAASSPSLGRGSAAAVLAGGSKPRASGGEATPKGAVKNTELSRPLTPTPKRVALLSAGASLGLAAYLFSVDKPREAAGVMTGALAGLVNYFLLFESFADVSRSILSRGDVAARGVGTGWEKFRGAFDISSGDKKFFGSRPSALALGRQHGTKTGSFSASRFFIRYLFLILAFFAAFRTKWIHFLSFVLGFFIVHVALGAVSLGGLLRPAKKE